MKKVIKLPQTFHDLDKITAYIGKDNLDAALRFIESSEYTFSQLLQFPQLGKVQSSGKLLLHELRVFPVKDFKNYLIFYRPVADGIEIIRVLHSSRDIPNLVDSDEHEPI